MNIISIEGNIGSGKSTLLAYLENHLKDNHAVIIIKEPIDVWTSIKGADGLNMIEKYYKNPEAYAFPFQMMAYISKLTFLMTAYKENPTATFITERSLYTDRYVFAKMLADMGKMEDVCYTIYLKWFDYFISEMNGRHRVVYVNTGVDVCYERIGLRNRSGEAGIPKDYLAACDTYHKTMIETPEYFASVHVFNGDMHRTVADWYNALPEVTNYIFDVAV